MSKCPIGLICEYFDCDRDYCLNLAKPWPIPLLSVEGWHKVLIPSYAEYESNNEWEIVSTDNYNVWAGIVRRELWLGGWWEAIWLPYEHHTDGGLMVTHYLELDESATLSSPWDFREYQRYRTHWECFCPPVPIDGYQILYGEMPPNFTDSDFDDAYESGNYILLKNGFNLIFSHHFEDE